MTILRVGKGRGFVVEISGERLVLTASHCLPVHRQYLDQATCEDMIGPLREPSTIGATCLSLDLITDLAVLAAPPPAKRDDRAAFEHLMILANPLRIAPAQEGRVWIMGLDGGWLEVWIDTIPGLSLRITGNFERGMNGSPILNDDDAAVSLLASLTPGDWRSGAGPHLCAALPAWLARSLDEKAKAPEMGALL